MTALLGLLLFAAGCGQKGQLFLPGDPDEGRTAIPGAEEQEELDADEEPEADAPEEPPRR